MPRLVAAAQFVPRTGDIERNIKITIQLLSEAASAGAKLVVFPELCICGRPSSRVEASDLALQRDSGLFDKIIDVCINFDCYAVFGFIELAYGNLYNSAALVGPEGLLTVSRKRNLGGLEFVWAKTGETYPSVVTKIGRFGILIGDDVSNEPAFSGSKVEPFIRPGSVDVVGILQSSETSSFPAADWVHLAESLPAAVIVGNSSSQLGASCVIDRNREIWVSGVSMDGASITGGYIQS